jgi:arylsulfatase A-like enzyme
MEYHSNYAPCGSYALRQGPFKLIRFGHSTTVDNASVLPDQLYDLDSDPHELHDLAPTNPATVAALAAVLEAEWGGPGAIVDIEAAQMADNIANYGAVWQTQCTPAELLSAFKNTWAGATDDDIVKQVTAWCGFDPRSATGPGGMCRAW